MLEQRVQIQSDVACTASMLQLAVMWRNKVIAITIIRIPFRVAAFRCIPADL